VGELGDQIQRLEVSATSPDGQLAASVRAGGVIINLAFRHRAYDNYREPELAHQLGQMATVLWTRFRRDQRELVEYHFAQAQPEGEDPHDRRYLERIGQITVSGVAAGGQVKVHTTGLKRWQFELAPGVLRELPEDRFVAEVILAVRWALAHYDRQVLRVKDEFFELGYPDDVRKAVGLEPRRR
jgi:hypothetical protein